MLYIHYVFIYYIYTYRERERKRKGEKALLETLGLQPRLHVMIIYIHTCKYMYICTSTYIHI